MANKTISDLRELSTVSNGNVLVVETNTETFKVTKENLLKEVNTQLTSKANVNHTHDEYVTENELNAKGLATETFVTNKIEEVSLNSGNVDLSGYATKDELSTKSDVSHTHSYNELTNKPIIPSLDGYATEAFVNQKISEISNGSSGSIENTVSIFKGLKATFYGDSLTEKNGHYTKGYHSWISDILGLESYENYGVSGFTIKDVADKVTATNANGDIIFIMAGVNDQTFHKQLGTYNDDSSTDTTYGALKLLCSTLKEKYPTRLIVYITPHYQIKYPSNLGVTSYEVAKAVKEVCYLYGIPVYDNFQLSGIYPQNTTNKTLYTTDGCHWNNLGHEKVGKNIAKYMINTFGYIYTSTPNISITLSTSTLSLNEGGSSSFTVRLAQQPSSNKTVTLSVNNSDIRLDKTQLTFTTSNWNVAQTVNVTVAEDDSDYNNESCIISLSGSGLNSAVVNITITDNDEQPSTPCTGISLNSSSLSFTDNTTKTLTATLVPSNTTDSLSWSVEPSGIVSVNNGVITPISNGECLITATCGSQTVTCSVNVNCDFSVSSSFIGKTCTFTSEEFSGYYHLTALIAKPDFNVAGRQLDATLNISNLSNIADTELTRVGVFTDETGEVENAAYKNEIINASVTDTINDNTATYKTYGTFADDVTYPYLKIPFIVGTSTIPASFKIDALTITVDGQEQEVLKLGGFFTKEISDFN